MVKLYKHEHTILSRLKKGELLFQKYLMYIFHVQQIVYKFFNYCCTTTKLPSGRDGPKSQTARKLLFLM